MWTGFHIAAFITSECTSYENPAQVFAALANMALLTMFFVTCKASVSARSRLLCFLGVSSSTLMNKPLLADSAYMGPCAFNSNLCHAPFHDETLET